MMMTSTTSHIRGQFEGTVLSNELICDEHYRMMLEAPGFPEIRPGQFAQLACREWDESRYEQHEMEWGEKLTGDEMTGQRAFLRRPFSFSGQEGSCIELIYRTVGVGTRWLSDLQPGKTLGVIGPLGNGFLFPPPGAGAILVGGGVGIPPMIHLASKLGSRAVAICGATREGLMPLSLFGDVNISGEPSLCAREFGRSGTPAILCTDDGSLGFKGFVTVAMERHLTLNPPKPGTTVYTCGPEVMMKRVAEIAKAFGLPCQVSGGAVDGVRNGDVPELCDQGEKSRSEQAAGSGERVVLSAGLHRWAGFRGERHRVVKKNSPGNILGEWLRWEGSSLTLI